MKSIRLEFIFASILILACQPIVFAKPTPKKIETQPAINHTLVTPIAIVLYFKTTAHSLSKIEKMLHQTNVNMDQDVIDRVLTTLKCANQYDTAHSHILTVIDYSLPSSQKRLWVFDLAKHKLLFYTFVSHAIKSGQLMTQYFSNRLNSKHSSLGVFSTDQSYNGRHGYALKLYGLDRSFNDNAYRRFIVMHGAWYVNQHFIKKYGRPGRSWGCPAIPSKLVKPVVKMIRNDSLFVVYYPSKRWFLKSKFLNCENSRGIITTSHLPKEMAKHYSRPREAILFADMNNNNQREVNEPIIAMPTDEYERIFSKKATLNRMLRRQINDKEYIALNNDEFKHIMDTHKQPLKLTNFIIPVVKNKRGYWATEFKITSIGKITNIQFEPKATTQTKSHIIHRENKPAINLRLTNKFIRWLGL